ncbi:glycerophosphodiester phosphodiesterase [Natronobiforma cellulositropha]|uniref:glycerophosphodiester phosphodiesterase n=1 Tax=Natronobiforma cellulositropha TaxID=1679076 RepID=UPI0021D5975E|nr:glycerophosphodiester phosphodiesterase [Natronobiforma cellulositropha]
MRRISAVVTGGLVLGALSVLFARARLRTLTVFAHRGFASDAPENTLEAVAWAAPRADAIEVDVRRCGSGELVCVHDATLERVAGVSTPVRDLEWDHLRKIELTAGGTVPRLADVLAALADDPDPPLLTVELKECGLADDLLDVLAGYDGDVLVSSFDAAVLASLRRREDSLALAYICRDARGALSVAERYDCVAIHPRADLCARTLLVARAHRHGLAVTAWTVDSRLEAALVALLGVDGVFSDRWLALESR